MQQRPDIKHAVDALSAGAILSSLVGFLPPVAALLGIVWYLLQIYGWCEGRWNRKKNYRRRRSDEG